MTNPKQRAKGWAHTLHADPYETVVGWQLFADEYDAAVERMARAMCQADGLVWKEQIDPMRSGNGDNMQLSYRAMAVDCLASIGIAAPKGRAR